MVRILYSVFAPEFYQVTTINLFFAVDDGAILDLILEDFTHPPPNGFDKIMLEQSLL